MAATNPHQQELDLISGFTTPSNLFLLEHEESFDKSWYQEYLRYRENVKSDFDAHQASFHPASNAYTAELSSFPDIVDFVSTTYSEEGRSFRDWTSRIRSYWEGTSFLSSRLSQYTKEGGSSCQPDDIAHESSADDTRSGGSLKEAADALICMDAGVESHGLPFGDFLNDVPGAEQGQLTHALDELDLIIEQHKAHTDQQSLDPERVSEERRLDSEAHKQKLAVEGTAKIGMEGIHVKWRRRGLPLLLEAHGGLQEIMTCYDTGTHENHMSHAKAVEMGYTVNLSNGLGACFELPNGKTIRALGYVDVAVQFAIRIVPDAASIVCRFNVFEKLARPVLIGMTFLRATETITKYTSRLVDLSETLKRPLRSYSMGNATNQVACTIDGREVYATADTGSEIALVSGEYAMKHRLLLGHGCEELELADGSLEYTSGFADVTVTVSKDEADPWGLKAGEVWKEKRVRFHVLENLQFDVILDEETIDDLSIFEGGLAEIVAAASSLLPSLSPIIHLRSVEASLTQASDTLGEKTRALCTSVQSKFSSIFSKPSSSPVATTPAVSTNEIDTSIQTLITQGAAVATNEIDTSVQARITRLSNKMCGLEQAENRRLDQIDKRGHASAGDDVQKREYDANIEQLSREIRNLKTSQGI